MSVRPNIQSLTLVGVAGTDLEVRGSSDASDPTAIFVVVTQDAAVGAGRLTFFGPADRAGLGWRATLRNTTFRKGPAEAMGVQVGVDPFQSTSWVQSLTIT